MSQPTRILLALIAGLVIGVLVAKSSPAIAIQAADWVQPIGTIWLHVRGRRDADAAFGLAYAHAEDDFATLQRALLAARGRLATLDGVSATENDYLVQLLGIWDAIAAHYETDLSAETRALLDGYATGFNLYAAQHRGQVMRSNSERK